jgi:hypothetical protein
MKIVIFTPFGCIFCLTFALDLLEFDYKKGWPRFSGRSAPPGWSRESGAETATYHKRKENTMMKAERQAQRLDNKIQKIIADRSLVASYETIDSSVQAELRLRAQWSIAVPVDHIHHPKQLNPDAHDLWAEMRELKRRTSKAALLKSDFRSTTIPISSRRKKGPAERAEAKTAWQVETAKAFLVDYKAATAKQNLTLARRRIVELQAEQKALLPELRRANSAHLAYRKAEKAQQVEALAEGRFWACDKKLLKDYFHPPFRRNYLSDVSERWRAALYTEMADTAWKAGKGDWRHKNIGTGRGYLCGIDDNGDEWGHAVNLDVYVDHDKYGDMGYVANVEEAMSALFTVPIGNIDKCTRQGDLLFCPVSLLEGDKSSLDPEEKWSIRESHQAWSPGLRHNGVYFASHHEIMITHTSHQDIVLPPGEYRLYTLDVEDAD